MAKGQRLPNLDQGQEWSSLSHIFYYFHVFSLFSHPLSFITYCSSWVVTKRLVVCQIFANARQEKRCSYCSEQGPITQVQTWFIWIGTDVFSVRNSMELYHMSQLPMVATCWVNRRGLPKQTRFLSSWPLGGGGGVGGFGFWGGVITSRQLAFHRTHYPTLE